MEETPMHLASWLNFASQAMDKHGSIIENVRDIPLPNAVGIRFQTSEDANNTEEAS